MDFTLIEWRTKQTRIDWRRFMLEKVITLINCLVSWRICGGCQISETRRVGACFEKWFRRMKTVYFSQRDYFEKQEIFFFKFSNFFVTKIYQISTRLYIYFKIENFFALLNISKMRFEFVFFVSFVNLHSIYDKHDDFTCRDFIFSNIQQ